MRTNRVALGVAFAGLVASCQTANDQMADELERVAKDWCLTIRASQVLPVYPLTEDLQPGDVFVTNVPLRDQVEIYEQRGFLPLDQHVVRLDIPAGSVAGSDGISYADFYSSSLLEGVNGGVSIRRPGWERYDADTQTATSPTSAEPAAEFVPLPRAAFPTYNFSVQEGKGLKLAIPIQGVPVGLGLMGTSRAQGSVTLSDAYTYGVDIAPLYMQLEDWWYSDPKIAEVFGAVAEAEDELYLRVVSRVYMIKGVDVALQNLEATGAGADAGVSPALDLLDLSTSDPTNWKASADAYNGILKALSETGLGESGGSFQFSQASQRSVAMSEDFGRPLVVGYLGFDIPIDANGMLGAPVPSFTRLQADWLAYDVSSESGDAELNWSELEFLLEDGASSVEVFPDGDGYLLRGWFADELEDDARE